MQFRLGRWQCRVDVPHLVVAGAIVGYCGWYFHDARANARDIADLLLIQPVAIASFVIFLFILRDIVRFAPADAEPVAEEPAEKLVAEPEGPRKLVSRTAKIRAFGSMGLLAAYVLLLGPLRFDGATFLYIAAELALLGERRWPVLLFVPAGFCAIVIYGLSEILQQPIPVLLPWFAQ